jgi:hypothetical protein
MTGRGLPGWPEPGRLKKPGKQKIFIRLIPDLVIPVCGFHIFVFGLIDNIAPPRNIPAALTIHDAA